MVARVKRKTRKDKGFIPKQKRKSGFPFEPKQRLTLLVVGGFLHPIPYFIPLSQSLALF